MHSNSKAPLSIFFIYVYKLRYMKLHIENYFIITSLIKFNRLTPSYTCIQYRGTHYNVTIYYFITDCKMTQQTLLATMMSNYRTIRYL